MLSKTVGFLAVVVGALTVGAGPVLAQSQFTLSWQLQPFCNNLTLNITQQGAIYTVDGFDDQCGAPQRAPLAGVATQNPDGTIGFGLHIVTVPGGRSVDIDARIALATISGPWSDSLGNTGNFAFNARTGGLPRPLPTAVSLVVPAGSIGTAQLAPAAVATANLADGSVTAAKLAIQPPKLVWSGLTTTVALLGVTNVVQRTVTIPIPSPGQVTVSASGLFGFATGGGFVQVAWCSITTGNAVETAQYLYAKIDSTGGTATVPNIPFAGTRVYPVTPGSFTVNLVCTGSSSFASSATPNLQTAQLTALFVAS